MKYFTLAIFLVSASIQLFAQELKLTNAVIVGQLDKEGDRYLVEVALTELFNQYGVKAIPSMNVLKVGNEQELLASDSVQAILKEKGFDTYVLVSVRGFDKRFQKSEKQKPLLDNLKEGHLFPIYKEEAVSVSFEFFFYRNGQHIGTSLIKCGGISSRDGVIKKFRKKVSKKLEGHWR